MPQDFSRMAAALGKQKATTPPTGKLSFAVEMHRIKHKLNLTPKQTADVKVDTGVYGMATAMANILKKTKNN